MADAREREDLDTLADPGMTGHHHMRMENRAGAELNVGIDAAERSDARPGTDPGSRRNDRGRVDFAGATHRLIDRLLPSH